MNRIVGDPLTGSLPRTRLVPQQRAEARWPAVPDDVVGHFIVAVGKIVTYRTRFGPRTRRVRVIRRSVNGSRYFVGDNRRGLCWPVLFARVISVRDTIEPAIIEARAR